MPFICLATQFQLLDLAPYLGSLFGAALIFIIVRLAIRIRNSSDLSVRIKRFLSLSKNELKFSALFSREGQGTQFEIAHLVKKHRGKFVTVASLELAPLLMGLQQGRMDYKNGVASFTIETNGVLEAILEFALPDGLADEQLYLLISCETKKVKARIPASTKEEWVTLQRG